MGPTPAGILLVDDDPDDVFQTQRALRQVGLANPLHLVGDGELAIAYLAGRGEYADRDQYPLPSLILLDLYMPRKTGFEVLVWLRQQAALRHILVVVLSSSKIPTDLQRAFTLGANSYLIKPLLPEAMKDMLAVMGLALTMTPRILLIEDDPDDCELVRRELRGAFPSFELAVVGDTAEILQVIEAGQFDLVITDFDIGQMNGLTVLHSVKARWPDRPVIMFTGTAGEEIAVEAMKVGLDDYIVKTSQHFGRLGGSVRLALGRARARQTAREAESRYQSLFGGVPVGLFRTTEAGQILDANPALVQILGYPDRESVLMVNLADLYVDPEDRARWDAWIAKEGPVQNFEARLRRHDGAIIWVRGNAEATRDADGRTLHFDGFVEDITDRKRADKLARLNRDLRTISLCDQALVRAVTEEELLREICRIIVEGGEHRAAWVGFVAEGEERRVQPVAVVGCEPECVDWHAMNLADPAWATCPVALAIRTGAVQVAQNTPGNSPCCSRHDEAVPLGIGSSVSLPLKQSGRPFGVLTIYSALLDAFDAEDVSLLGELANDLVYGIQTIRARAAHERALAEIESLARLPNESPNPIMRVREDGVILYANAPSGPLLQLWGAAVGGRMPAEWGERVRHVLETRAQESLDVSCGNRLYWILLAPIPEAGYANLYGRDITERKQGEAALRTSESRFRRLFESARDGIFLLDVSSGEITDVNTFLLDLLGYSKGELLGKRLWEISPFRDIMKNQEAFSDLQAKEYVHYEHLPLETKAGRSVDVEFISNIYRVNGNRIIQCNIRDITDRKRLERERIELEAQLRQQQKIEAIGTLASGVAHEINNPITGIMNYAQLIADKVEPKSQTAEYAGEILQETGRVATIVRNLLQFARQEKQTHSPARMEEIIEQTLSLFRAVLRRDQITLTVDVPEDLPSLKCRSQQLQQVLMNLLTNARDALNEKYPGYHEAKTIRITAREVSDICDLQLPICDLPNQETPEPQSQIANRKSQIRQAGRRWLRLTVADQGTGIPPEIQARIFDPFFTTKPRDKGTGLGLSISHGIVQDHHGVLHFETEPGTGTQFHLDLPVDNGWTVEEE